MNFSKSLRKSRSGQRRRVSAAVLKADDVCRVVLDKEVQELLKVEPRDKVLAITSSEGVLMVPLKGKSFNTSLPGFHYKERDHEASRFLFKQK